MDIERIIGYEFKDRKLLEECLTHKSVDYRRNYERLEFLGDSLYNFLLTRFLWEEFGHLSLTELALAKRYFMSNDFLSNTAKKLGLEEFIKSKRRVKDNFLSRKVVADVIEALLAGIYLDGGIEKAYEVFKRLFGEFIRKGIDLKEYKQDYKTSLLRLAKERFQTVPVYKVLGIEGVNVVVECRVKHFKAIGHGADLKTAEQNSAKKMLSILSSS